MRILRITHRLALEGAVPRLVAEFNVNLVEDTGPGLALASRDTQRAPGIRSAAGEILDKRGHLLWRGRGRNRDPRVGAYRLAKLQEFVNAVGNIRNARPIRVEAAAMERKGHLELA